MHETNLIFDVSNLSYITFYSSWKDSEADDILTGLCNQATLIYMLHFFKTHKPDNVIVAFDSHSWRKSYTKDLSTCVTHKKYKGQRRKNLTDSQKEKLEQFDKHLDEFHEILSTQTKMITLKGNHLEADDLIAGWIKKHSNDNNIIISADKDFIQLLRNPYAKLINPMDKKERDLSEWGGDVDLFMFEKCIRGDASDNVQSSYPRLFKKKILEAMTDDFKYNNIMNHEFKVMDLDEDGKPFDHEYITSELFEENELLMDLTKQPRAIKKMIKRTIKSAKNKENKFDYYKFMRYCSQNNMVRVCDTLDNFKDMLKNQSPN